jgi:hypothetical protein
VIGVQRRSLVRQPKLPKREKTPPRTDILARMTGREERIARNEVLFRDLNERLRDVVVAITAERPSALEIFCECGSPDCATKITVPLAEYEHVRSHPERFLIDDGHEAPDVERVIQQSGSYAIVEKHEEEAQIARKQDPRP